MAVRLLLAICVVLTLPVSQLRTVSITTTCCCPDPTKCHCPDHKADHSTDPSMRACHKSTEAHVAPQLPSFSPPQVAIAIAPAVPMRAPALAPEIPHEAPPADEPYGPS